MRVPAILFLFLAPCIAAEKPYAPRISQVLKGNYFYSAWEPHDIDGDGKLDLLNCLYGGVSAEMGGMIRNEGGRSFAQPVITHFRERAEFETSSYPVYLDGGSGMDLFCCRTSGSYDNYSYQPVIIPMDKPGHYGERIPIGPVDQEIWMPVDLDNDRRTEFLSFDPGEPARPFLKLWERQVDGSYAATIIPVEGNIAAFTEILVRDLDGDGDLDLFLINSNDDDYVQTVERTGPRAFGSVTMRAQSYYGPDGVADLDGDGLPEAYNSGYFGWQENLGDFGFGPMEHPPESLQDSDLIKVQPEPGGPATLYFSDFEGTKHRIRAIRFGTWDVISDVEVDAAVLPGVSAASIYSSYILPLEDYDNDGKLDLAFVVHNRIFRPDGYGYYVTRIAIAWGKDGGFESPIYIDPDQLRTDVMLTADFNTDGSKDLILGPDSQQRYAFLGNQGDGNFNAPRYLPEITPPPGAPAGTYVSAIRAADLDGDGILDLAVGYAAPSGADIRSAIGIALGHGNGTFTVPVLSPGAFDTISPTAPEIDHLVDWDLDGDLDAIARGRLRENLGGGRFSDETRQLIDGGTLPDLLGNPMDLVITRAGDIDGDGFPDIVSLIYDAEYSPPAIPGSPPTGTSSIAIGYNDGHGGISAIATLPISLWSFDLLGNVAPGDLQIADLNNDGRADLCTAEIIGIDLLGNPYKTLRWRRNPGGGSRDPAAWTVFPLGPQGSILPKGQKVDFDGDGISEWVDVIDPWELTVGYIRPTSAGPVRSVVHRFCGDAVIRYLDTFAAADFDGDGDTDFLMGANGGVLLMVKNPIVDERSTITRHLVQAGVKGSLASPAKDADGDGRSNEMELLMGTDPQSPDTMDENPLATGFVYGPAVSAFHFRQPSYAVALDLHYQVEQSADLSHWSVVGGDAPSLLPQDGGWNAATLSIPNSGPRGFYRIKASHTVDGE